VSETYAQKELLKYLTELRHGGVETVEFTMRMLQWKGMKEALQSIKDSSELDFRVRDLARDALKVYEREWPQGRAYRTYKYPATD
jgi:hypothetical protein